MNRYFEHTEGFSDNTKYVVVNDTNKTFFLIFKDGTKSEICPSSDFTWTLEQCIMNTRFGNWREVSEPLNVAYPRGIY